MLKKTITYTDYNGVERKEDHYFNLNKAELTEMELSVVGGYAEMINRLAEAEDVPSIMRIFKEIIFKSYGKKSPDGKRFIKSEELSKEFSETPAYSELFVELVSDPKAMAAFINGIIPANMVEELVNKFPTESQE